MMLHFGAVESQKLSKKFVLYQFPIIVGAIKSFLKIKLRQKDKAILSVYIWELVLVDAKSILSTRYTICNLKNGIISITMYANLYLSFGLWYKNLANIL